MYLMNDYYLYKTNSLALTLPESKLDVENLPILSCFSLKLYPEPNDHSLASSLFLNKAKSLFNSQILSENFRANNV